MNQTFRFNSIPTSADEIRALRAGYETNPHYIAALTCLTLSAYPDNSQAAIDMLNVLKGPQELSMYEKQFLRDRFSGKPYIMKSYFAGATVQNQYEPTKPYTIEIIEQNLPDEAGYKKLYVKSAGADSIRPITLRQKASTGEWFLWEQMILSDIRVPAALDPWA